VRFNDVNVSRPSAASIERLARWWSGASQAERFALLQRTIKGDQEAPTFSELQVAIFLAEAAAGEIAVG
jgi:hypothetical protein